MSIDVLSYRCIMIYLAMYISNLSIYLSIHPSIYPSIHPSIYLCIYIYTYYTYYTYYMYIYVCRTVANGSFVCNARNEHMQERTHQRTYITRCTTVCVYIYMCVCARARGIVKTWSPMLVGLYFPYVFSSACPKLARSNRAVGLTAAKLRLR